MGAIVDPRGHLFLGRYSWHPVRFACGCQGPLHVHCVSKAASQNEREMRCPRCLALMGNCAKPRLVRELMQVEG